MNTSLSTKDQILIALNGSAQFLAKTASANDGEIPPDRVLPGHHEMRNQLLCLAELCQKTAEFTAQGYPAKYAMTSITQANGIDDAIALKLASLFDEIGGLVLRNSESQQTPSDKQDKTASRAETVVTKLQQQLATL